MGVVDIAGKYRPVARRMRAYAQGCRAAARVSRDALLLMPTPHLMGLDRIDTFTTAACLVGAMARLGVVPEVKATYFQGKGPIPLEELEGFRMVVLGADEYRKDFPEVPRTLRPVRRGRRAARPRDGQPRRAPVADARSRWRAKDLAALTGNPKVMATNHQHATAVVQVGPLAAEGRVSALLGTRGAAAGCPGAAKSGWSTSSSCCPRGRRSWRMPRCRTPA